jgi:glyoxylase-like metal-dependent hydrolase (beta-lactamase superfamily II)
LNKIEAECFIDPSNIIKRVGVFQIYNQKGIDDWLFYTKQINAPKTPYSPSRNHAWYLSSCRLDGIYEYEESWQCGNTEFKFIHTPGHSAGFCCVYFPGESLIYTGDIDLTEFGPYYGGTDSNINDFITSSQKIANLDLKYYATGHEVGTIFSAEEFRLQLEKYLTIIEKRDAQILNELETGPQTLDDLTNLGMIYGGPKYLVDPWVYAWEKITILKHLERLETKKLIIKNELFYELR